MVRDAALAPQHPLFNPHTHPKASVPLTCTLEPRFEGKAGKRGMKGPASEFSELNDNSGVITRLWWYLSEAWDRTTHPLE